MIDDTHLKGLFIYSKKLYGSYKSPGTLNGVGGVVVQQREYLSLQWMHTCIRKFTHQSGSGVRIVVVVSSPAHESCNAWPAHHSQWSSRSLIRDDGNAHLYRVKIMSFFSAAY